MLQAICRLMVTTVKLHDPETYVVGPPPERVRVTGVSYGTVVAGRDGSAGRGFIGFFLNPLESEALEQMCREVREGFDTGMLELTLAGMAAISTGSSTGSDYVSEHILKSRKHLTAALQSIGVLPKRISERYIGGGLVSVTFNLRTGRLQILTPSSYDGRVGRSGGNEGTDHQSKPAYDERHDPSEPANAAEERLLSPPEPNEERFWQAMAAKQRRQ